MTQSTTLSEEEMASLTTFVRITRAARRQILKERMLQAVRESNGMVPPNNLTALTDAVTGAVEALKGLRPTKIGPASRRTRKRAGAAQRRLEGLRSQKRRM